MSKKQEFIDATTATIYTNGQEKVTAQGVQNLLNNDLSPNVVWTDNQMNGFGNIWMLINDSSSTPTTEQFSVNDLTVSGIDELKIHRNSIGVSFDGSINKLSNIMISDEDGKKFVFEVSNMETYSSYIKVSGSSSIGTLTTLVIDDNYYITFMYGDNSETVPNYFCTSWAEVKTAVALSNSANGGNIYMSGDIILTESPSWDVTNIKFFGSSNCRWRVLNTDYVADGSQSKYITITSGSTTFKDVQFRGSGGGASGQTFSSYSSRPLIVVTSGDSDLSFENCQFQDIIGGISNPIIEYTSITASTGSVINFDSCVVYSRDNSTPFAMSGFLIKATSNAGNLSVSVTNQRLPITRSGTGGTDLMFLGDFTTPANVKFYTDGTANGNGDFTNFIDDSISILENNAGDLSGSIMWRDDTDGVIKNITFTQLKTLFGL